VALDSSRAPSQQTLRRGCGVSHIGIRRVRPNHCFSFSIVVKLTAYSVELCRFSKRDFDELMHAYTTISSSSRSLSFGASPLSGIRCCLLLPCEASENEIFRVGKHLHTLLKIQGSLYYRTLDVTLDEGATSNRDNNPVHLLNEDGKLSEESFRRFARYRIKKEEVRASVESAGSFRIATPTDVGWIGRWQRKERKGSAWARPFSGVSATAQGGPLPAALGEERLGPAALGLRAHVHISIRVCAATRQCISWNVTKVLKIASEQLIG
jgi:hypothetical protein